MTSALSPVDDALEMTTCSIRRSIRCMWAPPDKGGLVDGGLGDTFDRRGTRAFFSHSEHSPPLRGAWYFKVHSCLEEGKHNLVKSVIDEHSFGTEALNLNSEIFCRFLCTEAFCATPL